MSKDLVVGRASLDWMEELLAEHTASLGLSDELHELFQGPGEETALCFLNGASVVLFLDYASALGGYPDRDSAYAAFQRGDSKFGSLPWWDNSIWLPFEFTRGGTMKNDPTTFVGSCSVLLKELQTIRQLSREGLGAKPRGYEEMRKDITAFYKDTQFQLDDADTIRWIWRALYDGVEIAMASKSILWAGP
jgi:hypothetical protein